jgi:hypothetical protein
MPRKTCLIGHVFGELSVIARTERDGANETYWLVQCHCKSKPFPVRQSNLTRHNTQRCEQCANRLRVAALREANADRNGISIDSTVNTLRVIDRGQGRNMWRVRCIFCSHEADLHALVLSDGSAVCTPCHSRPKVRCAVSVHEARP